MFVAVRHSIGTVALVVGTDVDVVLVVVTVKTKIVNNNIVFIKYLRSLPHSLHYMLGIFLVDLSIVLLQLPALMTSAKPS